MMLVMGAIPLVAIYAYISRVRFNEFVALHLIMFWLEMFFYGAIWIGFGEISHKLSAVLLFMLTGLLCVYVGCTLALASPLRKYSGITGLIISQLLPRNTALPLLVWLIVKAVLYFCYGTAVFGANDRREFLGVPVIWVGIDSLLLLPAWGGFFAFVVRLRLLRKIDWTILPLWILFFVVNLLFESNGGGKRVLITTALFYLLAPAKGISMRLKSVIIVFLVCTGIVVASNYYEATRRNFGNLIQNENKSTFLEWTQVYSAFQVDYDRGSLAEELRGRESPVSLLYELTEAQETFGLAKGAVARQVIENILPNGLFDKHYENENTVLSRLFKLPETDLTNSSLAVIQAETSIMAYLLTPLLYLTLIGLYLRTFVSFSFTKNSLIRTIELSTLLGALANTAAQIRGHADVSICNFPRRRCAVGMRDPNESCR